MIQEWSPSDSAIYDIHKTYAENAADGPYFAGSIPKHPSHPNANIPFLGFRLRSKLGVPAGPLLNAKWIALAASLGFDVLTYKTIRSFAHPGHQLPNVTFVNDRGQQIDLPKSLEDLTITNSFGMPSQSPDFLLEDIEKANRSLTSGQVMIVSIVGTPNRGMSFVDDFVRTACLAIDAGAKIVEANFSCPNVDTTDGILYNNAKTVHEYTQRIARAIHPTPLLIKVGVFENRHLMRSTLLAAARGGCAGVCGINTISMAITPPLDEMRKTSGVCGAAIRDAAIAFVMDAAQIIQEEKLDLALLGCGGITLPKHFDEFFDAGAQIALSATGMMWDPYLAMRYHERTLSHP